MTAHSRCSCYNHYSGHSDHRMQDIPLQQPLSDGPLLVLCI